VDGASCGLVGMDLVGVCLEHCAGYGGADMEARLGATLRFVLSEREEFAAPHRIGSMAKARAAACNCAAGGQTKCEYYIQLFYMRPLQRGTALHMPLIDPLTRRSQHALLLHIPSFLPHSPAATRTHRLLVTPRARAPSHDAREDLPHSAFGGLLRLDNPCRSRSRCRLGLDDTRSPDPFPQLALDLTEEIAVPVLIRLDASEGEERFPRGVWRVDEITGGRNVDVECALGWPETDICRRGESYRQIHKDRARRDLHESTDPKDLLRELVLRQSR
jgi:hypothetical protein